MPERGPVEGVPGGAPDVGLPPREPDGWEVVHEATAGVPWVAREPAHTDNPGRFRTNLVLTVVGTNGLSLGDWQKGTDELLPRVLDDYLLVDLERVEIDGRPGGRRLAHHAGPAGEALTMEQWFTLVDDVGHSLTATMETWRYDALAHVTAAAAATWQPGGEPGAG